MSACALPASPPPLALQEEQALERAQQAGQAAYARAGQRMAEQWLELTDTREWRHLAARFPEAIAQLSAAAAGNGVRPAQAQSGGGGTTVEGEAAV